MDRPPVLAIINTSHDVVDMLRLAFEMEGFVVVSAMTFDIRDGRVNLDEFLALHKPNGAIYDIAIPYRANWQLFLHLRASTSLGKVPIVLTTTNAAQVRPMAGSEQVHEIVDKPYDLNQIIAAVRQAIRPA